MGGDTADHLPVGHEASLALSLATTTLHDQPGDAERAARLIHAALGWSIERARWFLEINRDRLPGPTSP